MNVQAPLKIIDCDTHLTEPHDLFVSRAPAKYKDIVPQVKDIDGVPHWVFEGSHILGTTRASSVILPDRTKKYGVEGLNLKYHEVHSASYNIRERVKFMDATGIHAAIMYPNLLGFSGGRIPGDLSVKTMLCKIYNDAMAEFQEISGQRLFGMGLMPWWDQKETVREVERCHAMGIRGVNTNPNPQEAGLPVMNHDSWSPFLEICGELGMPINFHIGAAEEAIDWMGSVPWPTLHDDIRLSVGSATMHMSTASYITNFIMSGVCERFPKTQYVSVESGVGWIPFLLEALDYYTTNELRSEVRNKYFTMLPSEYFRRQFHACFWFEGKNIRNTIDRLGLETILWESDFPHPTCLYPNAVEYAEKSIVNVTQEERAQIMSLNAAKLYNIPVD